MIVAYPNEDQDTDFGFEYWLEADLKPEEGDELAVQIDNSDLETITEDQEVQVANFFATPETQEEEFETASASGNYIESVDNNIFYGLCGGAGVLLLAIIGVCYQCRSSK